MSYHDLMCYICRLKRPLENIVFCSVSARVTGAKGGDQATDDTPGSFIRQSKQASGAADGCLALRPDGALKRPR